MNILAFFAHPDDETILAGGTLALLAKVGAEVHFLCATRGEGGEIGEPPVCSLGELGEVREQELVCAVRSLGGKSLTFLGYTDPPVGPQGELQAYSQDLTLLAGQVAASLRQFSIDAVISHGSNGEYGHPAHVLTHQAARVAVESLGEQAPLLYTIGAAFPEHPRPRLANQDDPAHMVLDISSVLDQKTRAALCHRTQHALFVRRPSKEQGRHMTVPEVLQRVESLHRHYPPCKGQLDDPLVRLLRIWSVPGHPHP